MTAEDSSAYEAAHATVTILKALSESPGAGVERYALLPDTAALSMDEVIRRLIQIAKPVVCTGHRSGGRLDISCTALDPALVPGLARLNSFGVSSVNAEMREQQKAKPGASLIELRTEQDHVLLSSSGYQRWTEDYRINHQYSIGTRPADASSPKNVGLVMMVSAKLPDVELRLRSSP